MRFTAIATLLFGAGALAAPSPRHAARQDTDPTSEDVSITSFTVHKSGANGTSPGVVDGVGFLLSGEDAADLPCSAAADAFAGGVPTDVIACGGSEYRFALLAGPAEATWTLRIYHELGPTVGFYGSGDVPTYCHTGGLDTQVCPQVQTPVTIHIDGLSA
ncbi:hypothetical protein F4818DRAFT_342997 [Hypoxylon cercidicola]|nr:hypothetical protein F4818DRAFT_342997 [Hypoxylon cercidicola]